MTHAMTRLAAFVVLACSSIAFADDTLPPAPDAAPRDKRVGVGVKLSNGVGTVGGDVVVAPLPHLVLDLYGTLVHGTESSTSGGVDYQGFAIAPAVQFHVFTHRRSTPFVAVGAQYVHIAGTSANGRSDSGVGAFANVGYELKWRSGLGVALAGGVQYLTKLNVSSSDAMTALGGGAAVNLELAIRYMFL
jgi:hypothetical protein